MLCCLLVVACAIAVAEDGARLLVITTDALYNSILPLAEWRQATGLSTKVAKLSEVGSDTASIKNYIRSAWNNWPVKPEYVLLVGSPSNLPARYYQRMHGGYSSDNIYGDMTGDYQEEIPVGRFPAKSPAQLDLMVAKTLRYAGVNTPPMTDTLWMRKLTSVCRDAGDSDSTTYWADIHYAMSLARSNGFLAFDTIASSRGGNQTSVVNAVNAGTGLVMYRGEATGNWYTPFVVDPSQANGAGRLPVILSFTCATMTLNPGESMVGEAWVKAGTVNIPKGGVAFFGNTHSASYVAQQRSAVCRGFVSGLFAEHEYTLGLSCVSGKQQLHAQYPTDTADYRGFNLFGDPCLDVWTGVPRLLTVEHPIEIEPVPQQMHVVVTSAAGSEDSALVCASMDSTVYALGYTDSSGAIDLNISPANTGSLRLVVTGHNLLPYDTLVAVTNLGVEERTNLPNGGPVNLTVAPALFGRTTRISWSPGFPGSTVTVFDASGRTVATLRTTGSEAVWNATSVQAGAYVCVLTDPHGQALARSKVLKLE
jgi:hypothetical protein